MSLVITLILALLGLSALLAGLYYVLTLKVVAAVMATILAAFTAFLHELTKGKIPRAKLHHMSGLALLGIGVGLIALAYYLYELGVTFGWISP